jgi:hypothetical protein
MPQQHQIFVPHQAECISPSDEHTPCHACLKGEHSRQPEKTLREPALTFFYFEQQETTS